MVNLLTVPETSQHLRLSGPTVRSLLNRGVLKGFKAGRAIRIERESVEALVRGERRPDSKPAA